MNKKNIKNPGIVESTTSGIVYGANSPLSGKFGNQVQGKYVRLSNSVLGGRTFITGMRECMAFITVLITMLISRKPTRVFSKLKTSKAARLLATSALLGGPIAALSRFTAIDMIGSGIAGIFTGLWLIFLIIFGKLILNRQYNLLTWIGVFIMVIGGLVTGYASFLDFKGFDWKWATGIMLSLLTSLAWGLQHAWIEKGMMNLENDVSSTEANIYRYGISTIVFFVVLIPLTFAIDNLNIVEAIKTLSGMSFLWLILLGADAGISNILYFKGISKIGAVWSTVFYNMYVPAGLIWALIINQESLTWIKIVSALIVFIGMTIAHLGSSQENKEKSVKTEIRKTTKK